MAPLKPAPRPPAKRATKRPANGAVKSGAKRAAATGASSNGGAGRGESIARVYDQLRDLIVHGRLSPGMRIVESDIADRLGVSRTPVRSALHRLQQEGYVVALDGSREQRLTVAPMTQEDARELFHVVGNLEGLAARSAAELPERERAAVVARMRALNEEFAAAARGVRPDPLRVFALDTAFHRTYVEGGAGPRVLALHDAIKPQAERYARLYVSLLMDEIATSVAEHDVIIRHVADRSPLEAQRAVDENWRNAAVRLSKVIARLGERGSW